MDNESGKTKTNYKIYWLVIKAKKGNEVTYFPLYNDNLNEIDRITSISYTKEKFLISVIGDGLLKYLEDNYDELDLVVRSSKKTDLPGDSVLLRRYLIYSKMTPEQIKMKIERDIKIRTNQEKFIQRVRELANIDNPNKFPIRLEKILEMANEQRGKRIIVKALIEMGVVEADEKSQELNYSIATKVIINNQLNAIQNQSQAILLQLKSGMNNFETIESSAPFNKNLLPYLREYRIFPEIDIERRTKKAEKNIKFLEECIKNMDEQEVYEYVVEFISKMTNVDKKEIPRDFAKVYLNIKIKQVIRDLKIKLEEIDPVLLMGLEKKKNERSR